MKRKNFLFLFASAVMLLTLSSKATAEHVDPYVVAGNPTCTELKINADLGYKIDPPVSGTYNIDAINTVTINIHDGVYVDWSSTLSMDAVVVKGGPNANVYAYNPEETSDVNLHAPINPANNTPYGLSHISFCFDYQVQVSKTAHTSFDRNWDWSIEKTGSEINLILSAGQVHTVDYEVVLEATSEDSNWMVEGEVSVYNPAPMQANITSVTDIMSPDIEVDLDCPVVFPYKLDSGATLICTYSTSVPDGTNRTNTAIVTTTGEVEGGSAEVPVDFAQADMNETDECVTVDDDKYGPLGEVCASDADKTFNYTLNVGPYMTCGNFEFVNTASFVTNDTQTTGSDSWTVIVTVPCVLGCTLTQGYWKTHSSYGPAPYDDTWAQLPNGANTAFFLSGKSYYQVMWTPPAGNAYYNLAHQYIAAKLNVLNGASMPANVQIAYIQATTLFNTYTPAQIAALKGKDATAVKSMFISLAGTLGSYNEGNQGVLHCDE